MKDKDAFEEKVCKTLKEKHAVLAVKNRCDRCGFKKSSKQC